MLFERPETGERAILVHLELTSENEQEDPLEFSELVASAGGVAVAYVTGRRKGPSARLFVGTGKLDEIKQLVEQHEADIVLFNHTLSPSQERNLERELQCRVLDRTGLILDIFAQRARTHEGKLQVELAQLQHMSTRLIRGWTHLERQKGGIGLRGPGETQLETDRRLLRARIKAITKRLEKVRRQRAQGRRARSRAAIPSVSIVGYTNAGKSTLFNALTNSSVYAADQLFATLDPTMARLMVPDLGPVILADTVGFIRHLPHRLIEAFRATLEEAAQADLLLHVIDCADEERESNIEQVQAVLQEIGAGEIPQLEVYNKVDLLGHTPRLDLDDRQQPKRVWLSAQNREGFSGLMQAIAQMLGNDVVHCTLPLNIGQGRLRAAFYRQGVVLSENHGPQGDSELEVRIPRSDFCRILAAENLDPQTVLSGARH